MSNTRWVPWGATLGFALGGFFDGILLHQILQWHHLLSLVPGLDDLRVQVLWDGYFHALMYLIAIAGLWGLWRVRRRGPGLPRGAALLGVLLVGFGAWHVADGLLSHWLLGIHRIRLDSPNRLAWDVFWLVAFGLLPILLGRWLMRRPPLTPVHTTAALCLLAGLTATMGGWALREPPGQRFTAVVFAPGTAPSRVFAALDATGARLVWSDRAMGVVVVAVPKEARWRFYRHGALLVGGTVLAGGCVSASGA